MIYFSQYDLLRLIDRILATSLIQIRTANTRIITAKNRQYSSTNQNKIHLAGYRPGTSDLEGINKVLTVK